MSKPDSLALVHDSLLLEGKAFFMTLASQPKTEGPHGVQGSNSRRPPCGFVLFWARAV